MKTVTIPEREYKRLKACEKENNELLKDLVKGIKDIKEGRVKPIESLKI